MKDMNEVVGRINRILDRMKPVSLACSCGKDSTTVADGLLAALAGRKRDGIFSPPVLVTHADPGVDNPEMRMVADRMLADMAAVSDKYGLGIEIRTAKPGLNSGWAVRVLGGRGLPPFPENAKGRDCTTDFKVRPQDGLRKSVRKDHGDVVVMTGTRFSESSVRAARMAARGESPEGIWEKEGELFASPVADWEDADVWNHLARPVDGLTRMLDTDDLVRVYTDGATDITRIDGTIVPSARFGCCVCTAGEDKSMKSLIAKDRARYGYMSGLLDLQEFILATRRNPRLRSFPGRTVQDGYTTWGPDVYSPAMTRALYRYCLSLDADEEIRTGGKPRFVLVSRAAALVIDAMWSLYGFQKPFAGLSDWWDIKYGGKRFSPPRKVRQPRGKMPGQRYLHVGDGWESPRFDLCGVSSGNVMLDPETCHMAMENGPSGLRPCYRWERAVSVDMESLALFDDLEAVSRIREYRTGKLCHSAMGWETYSMFGVVTVPDRAVAHLDRISKRTVWRRERSMTGQIGRMAARMIESGTLSPAEMKRGARVSDNPPVTAV